MVKFSKTISLRAIEGWKEQDSLSIIPRHYLNYKQLKKLIKRLFKQHESYVTPESLGLQRTKSRQNEVEMLAATPAKDLLLTLKNTRLGQLQFQFLQTMDSEVMKVAEFYERLEFDLRRHLAETLKTRPNWKYYNDQSFGNLLEELSDVALEAIKICSYIEINITGMRKILKKFDKKFKGIRQPLKDSYLISQLQISNSHLNSLLSFRSIDEISLVLMELLKKLRKIVEEKFKPQKKTRFANKNYGGNLKEEERKGLKDLMDPLITQDQEAFKKTQYYRILQSKLRKLENEIENIDESVQQIQYSSSFATFLGRQLVLNQFQENLEHTLHKKHKFRQIRGLLSDDQGHEDEEHSKNVMDTSRSALEVIQKKETDYYPTLYLTLLHTFLYMVNYYLFAPTANLYTEALGMSRASSGNVLAMTPVASLTFAVLLSWWSNTSFKSPIIAGSVLILLGDIFYALAYDFNSVGLLLTGRFLFGIGGARAVLRRFIADFVYLHALTKYCAAFVAASALGLALGPGLSSILSFIPPFTVMNGFITFNDFTGPAWCSTLIWVVFITVIIFLFKEPDRSKSNQALKQREKKEDENQDQGDENQQPHALKQIEEHGTEDTSRDKKTTAFQKGSGSEEESSSNQVEKEVKRILKHERNCCDIYGPTLICLINLLILKVIQEALVTSSPIVMDDYFDWDATYVGYFFCALGSLVIPLNIFVGYISSKIKDRKILIISQCVAFCGSLIMIRYGTTMSLGQYLCGIVLLFLACQVMESVSTSILSKIMPTSLAIGILNSGFISTQAGTAGRAVGNFSTSITGSLGDIENYTFISIAIGIVVSIILVLFKYKELHQTSIRRVIRARKREPPQNKKIE